MPMKKSTMKPRRKAAPVRRRRVMRKKTNVPDVASCSVVVDLADIVTNATYNYESFRLSDSTRAASIAAAYQQYRIANVRLTWKPLYDTYAPGGVGGVTKPVLYHMIDRSRSIQDTFTLDTLRQMGCRPRALDEKPIQVNFKPGVLLNADSASPSTTAVVRYSPWLSTNGNADDPGASWDVSKVNHQGIKFVIQSADGGVTPVEIQAEYQIEFKKPNWVVVSGETAKPMQLATA